LKTDKEEFPVSAIILGVAIGGTMFVIGAIEFFLAIGWK